jgi:hypothetical protein
MGFREKIERRNFLQLSGLGFGAVVSGKFWESWQQELSSAERKMPGQPIVLQSAKLKVILDAEDGLPYSYELSNAERIRGEDFGHRIRATICNRDIWAFYTSDVFSLGHKSNPYRADFLFEVRHESKRAVRFNIRYELHEATFHTSLEDVQESLGFELIDVALPCLAAVREQDGRAWLAHGEDGGSSSS